MILGQEGGDSLMTESSYGEIQVSPTDPEYDFHKKFCTIGGGFVMTSRRSLAVFLLVLLCGCTVKAAPLELSPPMELLAGVLSQTTWIDEHGPQGLGNEYYRALKEFFAPYKEHRAVKLAQELTNKRFAYDAPPAFICHLGPLPDLELVHEYSDYLVGRAGGRDILEDLRLALAELAAESEFLAFYAHWEPYLETSLATSREGFRRELVESWLRDFFGWAPAEFYLIMTPSMFPGGGYGATVTDAHGNVMAFQIIRENGTSEGLPEFPSGASLENLTTHELGHSFVNPSLEAYPDRARNLRPLLWPVRKIMREQAYPSVTIFLNEQVLRGVEVIAARDLFAPGVDTIILENHEKRGFYLTSYVVQQLEYYQAHRDLYPTFTDFVPFLYDQLDLYQKNNSSWIDRLMGRFLR